MSRYDRRSLTKRSGGRIYNVLENAILETMADVGFQYIKASDTPYRVSSSMVRDFIERYTKDELDRLLWVTRGVIEDMAEGKVDNEGDYVDPYDW